MKAVALAAPILVLVLMHLLQRLEVWALQEPASPGPALRTVRAGDQRQTARRVAG